MISYSVYNLLHLLGVFLLVSAVSGVSYHVANGGTKNSNRTRKIAGALHGLGALIILVAGFGMLARLGIVQGGLPGWIWAKLVIWLLLGALIALPYRFPDAAKGLALLAPLLATLAAYFAIFKPF